MKRILFFPLLILMSCTIKYYLPIGAKAKYFLNNDEKYLEIDSQLISFYQYYIDRDINHQIPLNAVLKNDKYLFFLGFAINDTPEKIFKFLTSVEYLTVIEKDSLTDKNKDKIYEIFDKNENLYSYKLIFRTRKTVYTTVITYLSDDSAYTANMYQNRNKILRKIKY